MPSALREPPGVCAGGAEVVKRPGSDSAPTFDDSGEDVKKFCQPTAKTLVSDKTRLDQATCQRLPDALPRRLLGTRAGIAQTRTN